MTFALWAEQPTVFARLSYQEQRCIHDYFMPSAGGLTNQELRTHRKQVTTERPSLPHTAGRAVARLKRELGAVRVPVTAGSGASWRNRQLVGEATAKPEIDGDLVTGALLRAARDLERMGHDESHAV